MVFSDSGLSWASELAPVHAVLLWNTVRTALTGVWRSQAAFSYELGFFSSLFPFQLDCHLVLLVYLYMNVTLKVTGGKGCCLCVFSSLKTDI